MTRGERLLIAGAVLLLPVIAFFLMLALSPPQAGAILGYTLARLVDPFNLICIGVGVVAGFLERPNWAVVLGAIVGLIGSLLGYQWWERLSPGQGTTVAIHFVIVSVGFASYAAAAGVVIAALRSRNIA
jgi:hypothetical protein